MISSWLGKVNMCLPACLSACLSASLLWKPRVLFIVVVFQCSNFPRNNHIFFSFFFLLWPMYACLMWSYNQFSQHLSRAASQPASQPASRVVVQIPPLFCASLKGTNLERDMIDFRANNWQTQLLLLPIPGTPHCMNEIRSGLTVRDFISNRWFFGRLSF